MTLANDWNRSPVTIVWIRGDRFAAEQHLIVAKPFKAGIGMRTMHSVAERQLNCEHPQSAPQLLLRRSATRCVHRCPRYGEQPVSTGRYANSDAIAVLMRKDREANASRSTDVERCRVQPIGERTVSTGRYAHSDSGAVVMRKDREANAFRSPVVESWPVHPIAERTVSTGRYTHL